MKEKGEEEEDQDGGLLIIVAEGEKRGRVNGESRDKGEEKKKR